MTDYARPWISKAITNTYFGSNFVYMGALSIVPKILPTTPPILMRPTSVLVMPPKYYSISFIELLMIP